MTRFIVRVLLMLTVITTFSIAAARGIGAFIPMGRTMVFVEVHPGTGAPSAFLIDLEQCYTHPLALPHPAYDLRLSPNRRQLAYRADHDGHSDLYIFDWFDQTLIRVTNNTLFESLPAWSPNNAQLIYVRGNTPEYNQLMVYTLNNGRTNAVSPILETPKLTDLYWSSDGDSIAATAIRGGIYVFNLRTNMVLRLDADTAIDLAVGWSPNGKSLLSMQFDPYFTAFRRFDVYAGTSEIVISDPSDEIRPVDWLDDDIVAFKTYSNGLQTLTLHPFSQSGVDVFPCTTQADAVFWEFIGSFDIIP